MSLEDEHERQLDEIAIKRVRDRDLLRPAVEPKYVPEDSDGLVLELSEYERDNLAALLYLARKGDLGPVDTGDWCGQIYNKLGKFDPATQAPNVPIEVWKKQIKMHWEKKTNEALVELRARIKGLEK